MSVTMGEFVSSVEAVAPADFAENWDNTGLLLRLSDTVSKVLIALDVTEAVAREAEENGCDMVLAHHPLIFEPFKALDFSAARDAVLMRLIRAGISVYAAHTSFDKARGGINDALAESLSLGDVQIASDGMMRVGKLRQPCAKIQFLESVKRALGTEMLRVSQTDCSLISTVAVLGGSGGAFANEAKNAGAQALVTGEAKHSHFIEAQKLGILIVEAGHFDTERVFTDRIFMSLQARLNEVQLDLALIKSKWDIAPYITL